MSSFAWGDFIISLEGTYRPDFKSSFNLFFRGCGRRSFINPLQTNADEKLLFFLESKVKSRSRNVRSFGDFDMIPAVAARYLKRRRESPPVQFWTFALSSDADCGLSDVSDNGESRF